MIGLRWIGCWAFAVTAACGAASRADLYIAGAQNSNPARYNRFFGGTAFIGSSPQISPALDFSGVGHVGTDGAWVTMISPQYFVTAEHAAPAPSSILTFYEDNTTAHPHTYTVDNWYYTAQTPGLGRSDLVLGRLTAPIPAGDNIASYPLIQFASDADYVGRQIWVYGKPHRVGANNVTLLGTVQDNDPAKWTRAMEFTYDAAVPDEAFLVSGDSGAPSFILSNGRLAVIGTHYYNVWADEPVNTIPYSSGDSFVPYYLSQLIAQSGDPLTIVSGQWTNGAASGLWSTPGNWLNSTLPQNSGGVARLFDSTGPGTVTLDAPVTLRGLEFRSGGGGFTIASSNPAVNVLTLQDTSGISQILSLQGTHTISAPLSLANQAVVAGNLNVSGPVSGAGGLKLTTGALTLAAANSYSGGTTVSGGTLQAAHADALPPGRDLAVGGAGTLARLTSGLGNATQVGALSVDGGSPTPAAKLDLTNNKLAADKSLTPGGVAGIRAQIAAAYAGGKWTGNGITSSTAAADYAAHGTSALGAVGYLDNAIPLAQGGGKTTWQGRGVNSDSLLVRYTYYGDANLDGQVNLTDFGILKLNYGTGSHWYQADFNYDGTVNLFDFGKLKLAYGATPLAAAAATGAVPEPSSLALLAAAALLGGAAVWRRRRAAQRGF